MNGFDTLRSWFPWPEIQPETRKIDGWLHPGTRAILGRHLGPNVVLVAEVGSWMGKSATFILRRAPNAALVCIDTWLGNMHQYQDEGTRKRLPGIYDTFLHNVSPFQDRLVPVRATSVVGLQILRYLEIRPDLFFIDGSHETDDVRNDVLLAAECNPAAVLIGDDWQWPKVRAGVHQANETLGRQLAHNDTGWVLT